MGKVKGRAHRPAHPTKEAVWGGGCATQCQGYIPQCQALRVRRLVRVGKEEEPGPGPTAPNSLFSLLFQLQPWPHPPLSPHHQDHILPPDSGSGPDGPQDWKKPRWKKGRVRVSGVRTPRINTCRFVHLLLPVPLSQQPPPSAHCLCFPFCLLRSP